MRHRLAALAAVFTFAAGLWTPHIAFAWGDVGHEAIAIIAWKRLGAPVRAKVQALLAADKDTLTRPDFVSRATWADKWREHSLANKVATRQWHFVDIELDAPDIDGACFHHPKIPPRHASTGPAADCVVDKVDQFSRELKDSKTSRRERILALKYLVHFVGDMHQPLHVADHHDRGGNAVDVRWDKQETNLHAFWDTTLVEMLGSSPEAVAKAVLGRFTPRQLAAWKTGSLTDWAKEGFAEAGSVVYDLTDQAASDGAVTLDQNYVDRAAPVVAEQIAKAGVRLAVVLEGALR